VLFAAIALTATQCSLLVKTDLAGGIGAHCQSNSDCQASICDQGLCATSCAVDGDCPAPTVCAGARCREPLHVAAAFSGIANGQEGWTTSQKLGLDGAAQSLGYMRFGAQSYVYAEQIRSAAAVSKSVDDYVTQGADVIIVNSVSQVDPILQKAMQYPNIRFITVGGLRPNGTNVGSIFGRNDQSWMVAGRMAARESKSCIGLIVPLPQSAPVRSIDAFVLGAQRENPRSKVILRWMGFWKDISGGPKFSYKSAAKITFDSGNQLLYREELLAAELADLGCDVIAHKTDTQRSVSFIENHLRSVNAPNPIFSLAADLRDGCRVDSQSGAAWQESCLGTVYWNWAPILASQLDAMHRGQWTPANIIQPMAADDSSITSFEISPFQNVTGIGTEDARAAVIDAVNAGPDAVWTGPYNTTGQRDKNNSGMPDAVQAVAAGETPTQDELSRMCFFVQGIYEQTDHTDTDLTHVVPAVVPHGMDPNNPADMTKYGDVIQFVQGLHMDPMTLGCH
jgi:basic membrane lipoprotein Med (substrate-binding protein (PBP1-ABC) superfamily)